MFEEFYHLAANPFRLTPDPRFRYVHGSYARAVATADRVVQSGEGFLVITGAPGTGKTTFADEFGARLREQGIPVAKVSSTQVEAEDLLRLIAFSFGLDAERGGKASVQAKLERYLKRHHQLGTAAKLIIDEAQDLNSPALEELRLLSNLEVDYEPLLQTMLVGQQGLVTTLERPECDQMQQRIVASCTLKPLDAVQLRAYVAHRLRCVGWRGDPRISGDVLRYLHRFTAGIPRRINIVMARLLMEGAVEQSHVLDTAKLNQVLKGLEQDHLVPSYRADDFSGLNSPVVTAPLPALDGQTVLETDSEAKNAVQSFRPRHANVQSMPSMQRLRRYGAAFIAVKKQLYDVFGQNLRAWFEPPRADEAKRLNFGRGKWFFDGMVRVIERVGKSVESLTLRYCTLQRKAENKPGTGKPAAGYAYIAVGVVAVAAIALVSIIKSPEPRLVAQGESFDKISSPVDKTGETTSGPKPESMALGTRTSDVIAQEKGEVDSDVDLDTTERPASYVQNIVSGLATSVSAGLSAELEVAARMHSANIDRNDSTDGRSLAETDPGSTRGELGTVEAPLTVVDMTQTGSPESPLIAAVGELTNDMEENRAIEEPTEANSAKAKLDRGTDATVTTPLDDFVDNMPLPMVPEVVLAHIDIDSLPATSAGSVEGFSGARQVELLPLSHDLEFELVDSTDVADTVPAAESEVTPHETATSKFATKPKVTEQPELAAISKPTSTVRATAKTTAEKNPDDLLAQWLERADRAMTRNRLTLPEHDNAHLYYRKVLGKDSNNQHAQDGIKEILRAYLEMARARLDVNNLNSAQKIVNRGLRVDANHNPLLELQSEIHVQRELKKAVAQLSNRTAVKTQRPSPLAKQKKSKNFQSKSSSNETFENWSSHTQ